MNYAQINRSIIFSSKLHTIPCRPAKGSLISPPAGLPDPKPGRVASVVVGRVSSAKLFCPPTEPAILRGISNGWLRVLCWASIPVIRVARPSWVKTLRNFTIGNRDLFFGRSKTCPFIMLNSKMVKDFV